MHLLLTLLHYYRPSNQSLVQWDAFSTWERVFKAHKPQLFTCKIGLNRIANDTQRNQQLENVVCTYTHARTRTLAIHVLCMCVGMNFGQAPLELHAKNCFRIKHWVGVLNNRIKNRLPHACTCTWTFYMYAHVHVTCMYMHVHYAHTPTTLQVDVLVEVSSTFWYDTFHSVWAAPFAFA